MRELIALLQRPRRSTFLLSAAFIATFGVYLLVRPSAPPTGANQTQVPQPVYIVPTTSASTTVRRATTTIPVTTSTSEPATTSSSSSSTSSTRPTTSTTVPRVTTTTAVP